MNIYEYINKNYLRLSKGQRKVAQFILEQPQTIVSNIASEVGRLAGVSESTVIRFCYAMDLSGYNELQVKLEEYITVKNVTTSPKIEKATSNDALKSEMLNQIKFVSKAIEKLDSKQVANALNYMGESEKVFVVGFRKAEKFASFLKYNLEDAQVPFKQVAHDEEMVAKAIQQFNQNSALILFSEDYVYEDVQYIVEHAQKNNMKIILVNGIPKHEYTKLCNAHIYVHKMDENAASAYSILSSLGEIVKRSKNIVYA